MDSLVLLFTLQLVPDGASLLVCASCLLHKGNPKIYIGSPTSKATVYISGPGLAKNGPEISTEMSQDDLRLVS